MSFHHMPKKKTILKIIGNLILNKSEQQQQQNYTWKTSTEPVTKPQGVSCSALEAVCLQHANIDCDLSQLGLLIVTNHI